MELEGAAYLYALVAAAMTFVGFSAIVIILRQTMGATLSPFQLLLTQLLVEHGFVVVFLSLLPLLLTLFGIRHELVWQLSSAIAVFAVTVWLCNYLWRRYPSVRTKPQPRYVRVNMAIQRRSRSSRCWAMPSGCSIVQVRVSTLPGCHGSCFKEPTSFSCL